jgi:hypothetical protein
MNTHGMLLTIIILFAIAAAGGLIMAGVRVLRQRNPPAWLAMAHGLLAGAGLTLLLFAAFTVGIPTIALWALILLLIAAAGGLLMNLGYQWKQKMLPKPLMYAHVLIAAAGFILLIAGAIE